MNLLIKRLWTTAISRATGRKKSTTTNFTLKYSISSGNQVKASTNCDSMTKFSSSSTKELHPEKPQEESAMNSSIRPKIAIPRLPSTKWSGPTSKIWKRPNCASFATKIKLWSSRQEVVAAQEETAPLFTYRLCRFQFIPASLKTQR